MARVFDIFSEQRPDPNAGVDSSKLAQALGVAQRGAEVYADKWKKDEIEKGALDYNAGIRDEAKRIREGSLLPTSSKYYMKGYNQSKGLANSNTLYDGIMKRYEESGMSKNTDPKAALEFWTSGVSGAVSEMGDLSPEERTGLLQGLQQHQSSFFSIHRSNVNQTILENHGAAIDSWTREALGRLSQNDFEGLGEEYERISDAAFNRSGLAGEKIKDLMAKSVISYASSDSVLDPTILDKIPVSGRNTKVNEMLKNARDSIYSDMAAKVKSQEDARKKTARILKNDLYNLVSSDDRSEEYHEKLARLKQIDFESYIKFKNNVEGGATVDAGIEARALSQARMDITNAVLSGQDPYFVADVYVDNKVLKTGDSYKAIYNFVENAKKNSSLINDPVIKDLQRAAFAELGPEGIMGKINQKLNGGAAAIVREARSDFYTHVLNGAKALVDEGTEVTGVTLRAQIQDVVLSLGQTTSLRLSGQKPSVSEPEGTPEDPEGDPDAEDLSIITGN